MVKFTSKFSLLSKNVKMAAKWRTCITETSMMKQNESIFNILR